MAQDYSPGDFDIAIIGMAGRFPGAANLDEFWRNLVNGVESVSTFTEQEVLTAGVDARIARDPHYVRRGGVLDGAEEFDAHFFGIYPREAEIMDPQHRVFLELAWDALENAGYNPGAYPGMIGVYAGCGMNTYLLFNLLENSRIRETVHGYQLTIANDKDFLPTRVSYKLNLRGPSINVQTACSTSLVATHLACQALLNYQCDMALAGGVTIRLPQKSGYLYQEGGIASPDGHCRAFDADAAGTIGGNGAGIVLLKRLSDALTDRDTVHGVIRATALNNDGAAKVGYTAPSVEGQIDVIANAQSIANIDPRTISYVEAHGTGTALGDPIEIAALTEVFRQNTSDRQFCALGSLKTNIGHLDAAAGVASLIKTTLALEHGMIPPSLNYHRPNPRIDFASSPFYVNTEQRNWQPEGGVRRAAVSAFGIGGTNAHAILEEAPQTEPSGPSRPWQLLALSARNSPTLDTLTSNLIAHLKATRASGTDADGYLADIAYTLKVGRQPFPHRRIALVRDVVDAATTLAHSSSTRLSTNAGDAPMRSVAFMFTGQGSQYPGMGAGLYQTEPVFQTEVDDCATLLRPQLGFDIRTVLFPALFPGGTGDPDERLRQTAITQPALFVVEYALAQTWMAWGIRPDALIGHSIGEYVAACLAGVMVLPDALAIVAARGRLMASLPAGTMLSVALSEADVRVRLRRGADGLALAAVNAPELCVVSGPQDAGERFEAQLQADGVAVRRLHTSHAFHSAMMDSILSPFTDVVRRIQLNRPALPYMSNVTGTWITADQATDPAYYAQHLRQTVRFADGVAALADEPTRALLEVGPGRTLTILAHSHPAIGRARGSDFNAGTGGNTRGPGW